MNIKNRAKIVVFMLALPVAFGVKADLSNSYQGASERMSNRCLNFVSNNKKEMLQVAAVIVGWELTKLAYRRWVAPRAEAFFHAIGNWFGKQKGANEHSGRQVRASAHVNLTG